MNEKSKDSLNPIIIFDCDGTLISSTEAIFKSMKILFSEILNREVSREEILEKYTTDLDQLNRNFGLGELSKDDENKMMQRWIDINKSSKYQYSLFDGVEKLLQKLNANNFDLFVWTNRDRYSTTKILSELNVLKYFLEISCVDDEYRKPNSRSIKEAINIHREIDPKNTLMIGDTKNDIDSAANFGCDSMLVDWHKGLNETETLGANYKVTTLERCLEIINKKFDKNIKV